MHQTGLLIARMCDYFGSDARRINHFLKVYGFAQTIAEGEAVDSAALEIIETAAVTHDIGIKLSERKYGSSSGKYQEKEGPAEAEKLLAALGYNPALTARVCWLIGHHHTYTNIDSLDYQILVEADFLVNIFEDDLQMPAIESIRRKIFKTRTGIRLLNSLYLSDDFHTAAPCE